MKDGTVIFILVDTNGITENNKNSKIYLFDDEGQSEKPGDPKNYIASVGKNKKVVWMIHPDPFEKKSSKVSLLKISKKKLTKKNAHILKKKSYKVDKKGRVVGRTVDKKVKGEESYNISLKVGKKTFVIDPKLRMNP
jgi:hypothetical protein